ncbi:MAG: hypothetical protein JF628_11185 [Sphingomonas sp.]|nr:hypothetical protein [Sphingomonas sp.]
MMWKKMAGLGVPLLLTACAANLLDAAHTDCSAFGFQPGSEAFAACVERAYARHQQLMAAAWVQAAPPRAPAPPAASEPSQQLHPPQVGIAFLKSQTVQGMSRICTYNRMGSPYVITIAAAEMCPISIP